LSVYSFLVRKQSYNLKIIRYYGKILRSQQGVHLGCEKEYCFRSICTKVHMLKLMAKGQRNISEKLAIEFSHFI